jgi:hypothetical protein
MSGQPALLQSSNLDEQRCGTWYLTRSCKHVVDSCLKQRAISASLMHQGKQSNSFGCTVLLPRRGIVAFGATSPGSGSCIPDIIFNISRFHLVIEALRHLTERMICISQLVRTIPSLHMMTQASAPIPPRVGWLLRTHLEKRR